MAALILVDLQVDFLSPKAEADQPALIDPSPFKDRLCWNYKFLGLFSLRTARKASYSRQGLV
jgi:hypothetical protein